MVLAAAPLRAGEPHLPTRSNWLARLVIASDPCNSTSGKCLPYHLFASRQDVPPWAEVFADRHHSVLRPIAALVNLTLFLVPANGNNARHSQALASTVCAGDVGLVRGLSRVSFLSVPGN